MKRELKCVDCSEPVQCLAPPGEEKLFYRCDRCEMSATKDKLGETWIGPQTKEVVRRGPGIHIPTEPEIEAGKISAGRLDEKAARYLGCSLAANYDPMNLTHC